MKIPFFMLKSVLVGGSIGITITDCIGYVARVEGVSMQPTLNPDKNSEDYVFLSRWALKDLYFERGDIVAMISPKDQTHRIVKRIVGLQGDIVSTIGYKKPYIKVPDGHCWVEGDHTGFSYDSNSFGPVSMGLVTARATYIVWPPSRWQCLQGQTSKQRNPTRISTAIPKDSIG